MFNASDSLRFICKSCAPAKTGNSYDSVGGPTAISALEIQLGSYRSRAEPWGVLGWARIAFKSLRAGEAARRFMGRADRKRHAGHRLKNLARAKSKRASRLGRKPSTSKFGWD